LKNGYNGTALLTTLKITMCCKNKKKGFTLIELLVVIAIIGVLAAVALPALNQARNKGNDAAIKGNLDGIRASAEIVYDTNGCYGDPGVTGVTGCSTVPAAALGACPTARDGSLFGTTTIMNAITQAKGAWGTGGLASCVQTAGGTAWAVAVPLKSATTLAWCVDSTGASKQETVTDQTQTNLNGAITGTACK
jgi:prepilin-type N-terminal cleavage/methylation domain-containing protein